MWRRLWRGRRRPPIDARRGRRRRRQHLSVVSGRRDPPADRGRQKWHGAEDWVDEGASRGGASGQRAGQHGRPLRRCGGVSDGGEGLVPFERRGPVEMFLVDEDARRGDDLLADEHVVPPLGIARTAEEGAEPAARAEARLVLVGWWLEHDGTRAEGGKVHHARRPAGESLVRRHVHVGRRGADGRDRRVVPLNSICDEPWPQTSRRIGRVFDRGRGLGDESDGALGDRVQIVVVWRRGGVVDELG